MWLQRILKRFAESVVYIMCRIHVHVCGVLGNICDDKLGDIKCPTLIVHGQKDALVPQFHADHLHKNIKGSR